MRGPALAMLVVLWAGSHAAARESDSGVPLPSPKPAANPNVVVLGGHEAFWKDPVLDNTVSLSLKNADLNAAVAALSKVTNLSMVARGGAKAKLRATLELKNVPIRDAMKAVAGAYGLRWHSAGDVYSLWEDSKRTPRFLPASAFKRATMPTPKPGVTLYRVNARKARRHPKKRVTVIYSR